MSVSGYFDRQRREQARTHAEGYVGAIAPRGLDALIPSTPPEPEPIPGLTEIPTRMKSFELETSAYDLDGTHAVASRMIEDLISKVLAEDRRVRRMLPPAPRGMEWHGELQTSRDDYDSFVRDVEKVRIVYALRPIPPAWPYER